MKSWPLAPMSSANAHSADKTGADGCPPIVLLQSSKSSACEAAPLTSAASRAGTRRLWPNRRLGPAPEASARAAKQAVSSWQPASVVPTVSRMPTFAQYTACGGKSAKHCEVMRCASSSARAMGPPLYTSRQCPAALPAGTAWATAVERSRRWASAAGRSLDVTRLGHYDSRSYSGVMSLSPASPGAPGGAPAAPGRVLVGDGGAVWPCFLRRARAESVLACWGSRVARMTKQRSEQGLSGPKSQSHAGLELTATKRGDVSFLATAWA